MAGMAIIPIFSARLYRVVETFGKIILKMHNYWSRDFTRMKFYLHPSHK